MREPVIIGNWKMNKNVAEAIRLVTEIKGMLSGKMDAQVVIAPPFTALNSVSIALQNTNIALGAQNVHFAQNGAYTGEISASMLSDLGVDYVIIGHSERRRHFGETDVLINKKIAACLEEDLTPVVCVGETQEERDADKTKDVLNVQVKEGLKGFRSQDLERVIIAYEPVWAIGTGNTATPEQAAEAHAYIRSLIGDRFGNVQANKIRIIYGGSVNPENITTLMKIEDIDGALVGGASLNSEHFAKIVLHE